MAAIIRNSSQVPTDTDTGKDELEIGPNYDGRSEYHFIQPNSNAMYYLICQDLFEMKEYFIFLGIYLLLRQYLEAMIDASQGSGEQENHNSALLLGMNCQVL